MGSLALVLISLGLGWAGRRSRRFPAGAARALNAFVIHVSLPALVLHQLPARIAGLDAGAWAALALPVSMPWLLFALAAASFTFLGRARGWPPGRVGALVLLGGLGNTSFVGFPLLEALVGPEAIPTAILLDQLGSFLALATVGVAAAARFGARAEPGAAGATARPGVIRTVLGFPPFLAVLGALALAAAGVAPPAPVQDLLARLAGTLAPVALFAVGLQLELSVAGLRRYRAPLAAGLAFKLVLAPACFVALYAGALGARGLDARVTLLESAMAPMITAGVLAEEFGLEPELARLFLGLGILLSLGTVPVWSWALAALGL